MMKKKTLIKKTALVMTVVMMAGLFAGCGLGGSGSENGPAETPGREETQMTHGETPGEAPESEQDPQGGQESSRYGPETAALIAAMDPFTIRQAQKYDTVPYPNESDYYRNNGEWDFDAYDADYTLWREWRNSLPAVDPETTYALNDFFADTAARMLAGEEGDNSVYSPLNIYIALSMLAEVTDGESRAQILEALGAQDTAELRQRTARLWAANTADDDRGTLLMANSLWLNEGVPYRDEALNVLADDYYASSFSGEGGSEEYNEALRAWINFATRGLLAEQASELEMSPELILALASTIYFKSTWDQTFDESQTYEETFHAPGGDVDVDFMHQSLSTSYYQGDGYTAAALPFVNDCSMWVFLPDEGTDPSELLEDGRAAAFLRENAYSWYGVDVEYGERRADAEWGMVDLSIPKFDVSLDADLEPLMRALGVNDVFSAAESDFTPLTEWEDVRVTSAKHAARLLIDEEGCEAAAFTIIMVDGTGAIEPEQPLELDLDRPFLFVLTSQNAPLFAGVVNNPA